MSCRLENITRGDRFTMVVTLPAALDLTAGGFTPVMQIRIDPDQVAPDATFSAVVSGATNNVVTFVLSSTVTLALTAGETYYGRLLLQHTDSEFDDTGDTKYVFTVIQSESRR